MQIEDQEDFPIRLGSYDDAERYYHHKSDRYDYGPLIGVLFVLVTGIASIVGFWQLVTRILP